MNMDQVMVCVYTDRNTKSEVIGVEDLWELLTSTAPNGKYVFYESDLLEALNGEFDYITFNQGVLDGVISDWEDITAQLNDCYANRSECNNYHISHGKNRAVYAFVNAGALDIDMMNRWMWNADPSSPGGMPTDYKLWIEARKNNYCKDRDEVNTIIGFLKIDATPEPTVEEKKSTKKPWLL